MGFIDDLDNVEMPSVAKLPPGHPRGRVAALRATHGLSAPTQTSHTPFHLNLPRLTDGLLLGASPSGKRKANTKCTPDGRVVHSFETLLDDLSSVVLNKVRRPRRPDTSLAIVTRPTPDPDQGLRAVGRQPRQSIPIGMTG